MVRRALISVFYKDGVLDLARALQDAGWEILSTGGTSKYLTENGIPVTDVSSVTGFPECLDGRVKTLHPKIHAGLLARRSDAAHMKTLTELAVTPIDLVCVNLYPFFEKVQAGLRFEETVEFIDIGGPSMLRSAAKNFQDVAVLIDPADYEAVIDYIKKTPAAAPLAIPADFRRLLAAKVFNVTSAYDAAVARFMFGVTGSRVADKGAANDEKPRAPVFPEYFTIPLKKSQELRYGENAHQSAALYLAADTKGAFGGMTQLQGKELSYNNIRDLDVAWKAVCAWNRNVKKAGDGEVFTVALKHNTPCGAACGKSLLDSYLKTHSCDPVSIFGGIIGSSEKIDRAAAEEMIKTFLEVIVAPGFDDDALAVFAQKKNLRLIRADVPAADEIEFMSVDGGALAQSRDAVLFEKWDTVTVKEPTEAQKAEMAFGMTVAMFAKSNAIVVVKDKTAIGIGAGQTNRIWAASQALERAQAVLSGAEVLISDAFFPFADCVEKAAEYGIKAIIQPGGSLRDQESIDVCNRLGIAMIFTGARHFKH